MQIGVSQSAALENMDRQAMFLGGTSSSEGAA